MPISRPELQLAGQCFHGPEDQTIHDLHRAIGPRTIRSRKVMVGPSGFPGLLDDFILEVRAAVRYPGMYIPKGRKQIKEAAGRCDGITGLARSESYKPTHVILND